MSAVYNSGNLAERLVADWLKKRKFKILDLNWKTRMSEIDIIAEKDKVIYFVEVKYRQSKNAGDGFDYITKTKLNHMERAAALYVSEQDWNGEFTLLAASVIGSLEDPEIELIEVN